ncbi:MAG: class I SAM-dependent methyltransferase [Pseudomonadota bacterium]
MAKTPGLDAAYGLTGADSVRELYSDWAESYDASFVADRGYTLHDQVAACFAQDGGAGPVLDVGAGTGVVGEALWTRGLRTIDGADLSAEMLEVARAKGCYRDLFVADITQPLDCADDHYGGVVSAGTFTLGHVGPEPLNELIRITRPGGLIVLTVNLAHWQAQGFDAALRRLDRAVTDLKTPEIPIYAPSADHDHAGDRGVLLSFRVA